MQTLCSGEARQELITVEAVSKGFVAQGFVWPFAQHIFILSTSVISKSEGIWFRPAMWSSYYAADSGQWRPYYGLLVPVVGHARPPWRIKLCKFCSLYRLSFSNLDRYFLFCSISLSYFHLFVNTFLYCLIFLVCVCVWFLIG